MIVGGAMHDQLLHVTCPTRLMRVTMFACAIWCACSSSLSHGRDGGAQDYPLSTATFMATSSNWMSSVAVVPKPLIDVTAPRSNDTHGITAIGLFHVFKKPPWGGGNQFLIALVKEFRRRKIRVVENEIVNDVRLYMANAVTFQVNAFRKAMGRSNQTLKLVHRLDGPYYSARYNRDPHIDAGKPWRAREDEQVYRINEELACASIFQSQWSYNMNIMLGYKPRGILRIVNNAVDEDIFHPRGRIPWGDKYNSKNLYKVRLMASSWSSGQRKGFQTFKWMDDHLDWTKFEFTFSGSLPKGVTFKHITALPPVSSEKLASILRAHHVFIAASHLEPCSNALVEALASGMPALFQSGSGHAELVKRGGLSYDDPEEIPDLLEQLIENYEEFQRNIRVTSISDAADMYLEVYAKCLAH